VFTEPSNGFGGNHTGVLEGYTSGTYTRTFYTSWGYTEYPSQGKGFTALKIVGIQQWQMSFKQNLADYGIPHNNTTDLFIRCRETWARYTPP
jgi:hypothetical protein